MRSEAELKRLEVEERRVSLSGSDTCVGFASLAAPGRFTSGSFDVASNLHLIPQFCEQDPDTFFSIFERAATVERDQTPTAHYFYNVCSQVKCRKPTLLSLWLRVRFMQRSMLQCSA